MTAHPEEVAYNFAVLRAVPHVHLARFEPIGVVLHARTREFLGLEAISDPDTLRARLPDLDVDLLMRYLASYRAVAAGDPSAGPVALAPASERFHWLTAPRSDVLQSSPIHEGICADPAAALQRLFREYTG